MALINMTICVCLLTLVAVCCSLHFVPVAGLSDDDIWTINNTPGIAWKARNDLDPRNVARWRASLDKPLSLKSKEILLRLRGKEKRVKLRSNLPPSFDARVIWRNCSSLRTIRDQSNCVSGYAVNTAAAITDRMCINGDKAKVNMSGLDFLACTHSGSGCCGGYQADVYDFYVKQGVVSGGPYNSTQGCMPYSLAPCHHSLKQERTSSGRSSTADKALRTCKGIVDTPKCVEQCRTGYNKTYVADKHFGEEWYWVQGVQGIMQELVDHGSLTASMDVWDDFYTYKSGVYKYVKGYF